MGWTDNPVRDAECHIAMQERYAEQHRKGKCVHCGADIHDYDDHYDFDGDLVCDDCLIDWARKFKK